MSVAQAGDGAAAPEGTTTAPDVTPDTASNDAPWSADLRALGLDDETYSKVDGYMREKVQPHTTKLEQDVSALREAVPEGLQQFWSDFENDPDEALTQLAAEAYSENPEAAEIFKVAIKYAAGNPDASDEQVVAAATQHVAEGGTAEEYEVELDPEDRERLNIVDEIQAEREDQQYAEALTELKSEHPDHFPETWGVEEMRTVMDPLVLAAPEELDDDAAMEWAFERYSKTYGLIHGGDPGTEGAAAEAAGALTPEQVAAIEAGAPPTITSGQNASVPSEKQYASIGEAVADFGRELRAKNSAPPVV